MVLCSPWPQGIEVCSRDEGQADKPIYVYVHTLDDVSKSHFQNES